MFDDQLMDVMLRSYDQFWSSPVVRSMHLLGSVLMVGLVLWLLHVRAPIHGGRAAVFVCYCAPLALYVVGIDWARWCGLAMFDLLLAELVMDRWGLTRPRQPSRSVSRISNAVVVAQVLLGPVGIVSLFPFLLLVRRAILDL